MQSTMTEVPRDRTIMATVERSMPDRSYIIARFGLQKLSGNAESYWSVTAEIYEPHGTWSGHARFRNEREPDGGGAAHDEILKAFPQLAPLVALHLSGPDGVPMHAVANAQYFVQRGERDTAARILRVDVDELPQFSDDIPAFVDSLRERWLAESRAGYALLESLI